jgi:hypothetical protein
LIEAVRDVGLKDPLESGVGRWVATRVGMPWGFITVLHGHLVEIRRMRPFFTSLMLMGLALGVSGRMSWGEHLDISIMWQVSNTAIISPLISVCISKVRKPGIPNDNWMVKGTFRFS